MSDIFSQLYGEDREDKADDSVKGYMKPSEVKFDSDGDNAKTFASYISSRKVGRSAGVVIPHATSGGRSPAFNPETRQRVFIDPEMTKGQLHVDLGKVSSEDFAHCVAEASKMTEDVEDRAVLAYAMMAKLVTEKNDKQKLAALIKQTKSMPLPASIVPDSIAQSFEQSDGGTMSGKEKGKTIRVLFELPKPIGKLNAVYSDVVRTDDLLILVYDHTANVSQNVWFPQPDDSVDVTEQAAIHVLVYDDAGNPDTMFEVIPTAGRFIYKNVEFCLLAISREKPCKPQE